MSKIILVILNFRFLGARTVICPLRGREAGQAEEREAAFDPDPNILHCVWLQLMRQVQGQGAVA